MHHMECHRLQSNSSNRTMPDGNEVETLLEKFLASNCNENANTFSFSIQFQLAGRKVHLWFNKLYSLPWLFTSNRQLVWKTTFPLQHHQPTGNRNSFRRKEFLSFYSLRFSFVPAKLHLLFYFKYSLEWQRPYHIFHNNIISHLYFACRTKFSVCSKQ